MLFLVLVLYFTCRYLLNVNGERLFRITEIMILLVVIILYTLLFNNHRKMNSTTHESGLLESRFNSLESKLVEFALSSTPGPAGLTSVVASGLVSSFDFKSESGL
jgi:competence protein ComGC